MHLRSDRKAVADPDGDYASSDRALLVRVAQGDTAAFPRLYDRLAGPVYGLCRQILRDDGYAEDVAQAALVELWHGAPRYDPTRATPLTWALTVAHHRAVDHVRALRATTQREARAASRDYTPATADSVADTVLGHAEQHQRHTILAALTPRQREALEIVYYQGHTHTEAASLLDIPLGTVKTRIRGALRRLRTTMVDEPDPAPASSHKR